MAINRKWCKTDGKTLTYAPTWLKTDEGLVVNPGDELYRAAGWMEDAVMPPELRDGMKVTATRYVVKCESGLYSVEAVYEYAPIPAAPKRYSKMKFTIALAKRGILSGWDEFASVTELLPDLTVKRVLDEATWMQSDDANFTAILDAVKARFGVDVIDAVLAESEDEEW